MKSNKALFFIIVLSACLTQIATDIYIPSLSVISQELAAPINLAQLSLSIYLLGVGLSQLIYGPLSEGIGRRQPLCIGFAIIVLGSIICASATSITALIIGRFIQGCGAGACAALWRSVFRDVYTGEKLASVSSYLVVVIMFVVPAAPAVGGYLQVYFNWQANFIFMAGYALLCLILIALFMRETSQHHHTERLKLAFIVKTYQRILTDRVFLSTTTTVFLSYGALFACIGSVPVLLMHLLGMDPVSFGWLMFVGSGAAYGLAGTLNGRCVTVFGIPTMLRFGFSLMLLSGALLLLGGLFFEMNIWNVFLPIALFYFGSTFLWPNLFANAFTPFGDVAGYAGALYGFMQVSGGAAIGSVIAYLPEFNQMPLALVVLSCSGLAWLVYELATPKKVAAD